MCIPGWAVQSYTNLLAESKEHGFIFDQKGANGNISNQKYEGFHFGGGEGVKSGKFFPVIFIEASFLVLFCSTRGCLVPLDISSRAKTFVENGRLFPTSSEENAGFV